MAILKHIKNRNANYSDALDYLLYQHDEKIGKSHGTQRPNGQKIRHFPDSAAFWDRMEGMSIAKAETGT